MKKIVCEICECTEFVKENGYFVCQECGCKFSPAEVRSMLADFHDEENEIDDPIESEEEEEEEYIDVNLNDPRIGFVHHTEDSPNRISVTVDKVGHETYTVKSVSSLSAFFGEPEPEFVSGPDVVGHIGAAITIRNMAGKSIKYITVYLTPVNNVGDEVSCTVSGISTYGIEVTGPFDVGKIWSGHSDGMWYNNTIVWAEIAFATVEYMDGTKEWFDSKSLMQKESSNESYSTITVVYDCNAGSAQELWYSIDDSKKHTLHKGNSSVHYLTPGTHTLTIKNPFKKKDYVFNANGDKTLRLYGKSFSTDIYEE